MELHQSVCRPGSMPDKSAWGSCVGNCRCGDQKGTERTSRYTNIGACRILRTGSLGLSSSIALAPVFCRTCSRVLVLPVVRVMICDLVFATLHHHSARMEQKSAKDLEIKGWIQDMLMHLMQMGLKLAFLLHKMIGLPKS